MTAFTIAYNLPFVAVTIRANGQSISLNNVLIDTGSAATVFRTDDLSRVGVILDPTDRIRFMTGIGGREAIVEKSVEAIQVGELIVSPFTVQMGSLDYDFALNGILGMDFLLQVNAMLDFKRFTIT